MPFASFIAVLIALPLAVRFGKKGRTLGIALSIVALFFVPHDIFVAVGAAFGKNGALDPWVAVVAAERHRDGGRRLPRLARGPVTQAAAAVDAITVAGFSFAVC